MDEYHHGPDFYDDEDVFETYQRHRARQDNPNDLIEQPIFAELVGDVRGLRVLDLGCGAGAYGRALLEQGAAAYTGVDGSQNMVNLAVAELSGTPGVVIRADLEAWTPDAPADLAISRLALHYIHDLEGLLERVEAALVPGGRFIFSVEHPVITSCDRGWKPGTLRQDWVVDDYFATGPRGTRWLGGQVIKVHRTVEDYFTALQRAGFSVEALRESRPRREQFEQEEDYQRRVRIPLFLFFSGRKRV